MEYHDQTLPAEGAKTAHFCSASEDLKGDNSPEERENAEEGMKEIGNVYKDRSKKSYLMGE